MKSFFESGRDESTNLHITCQDPQGFPSHFHSNLEVFMVRKGNYRLWLNEKAWEIPAGSIAVIDSFTIHSYEKTDENGEEGWVAVLPYRMLSRFNAKRKNMKLAQPVLHNVELCTQLLTIVDNYMRNQTDDVAEAATQLFLSILYPHLQFTVQEGRDEGALVRQILTYIEQHFREDVTRATLSKELGYSQEHISRVFHRYTGKSLSQYVNGLRLAYVETCLAAGDKRTATELVFEAGFKSQRTYYRQKKK